MQKVTVQVFPTSANMSYLRGRPSNALTEAMQPAQEVFWSASFAKCCFSSTMSVGGLQLVAIATGHVFLHEP